MKFASYLSILFIEFQSIIFVIFKRCVRFLPPQPGGSKVERFIFSYLGKVVVHSETFAGRCLSGSSEGPSCLFLVSGGSSYPWHLLVCVFITCSPSILTLPVPLCGSVSYPLVRIAVTGLGARSKSRTIPPLSNYICKMPSPNKVIFWHFRWTWVWRDNIQHSFPSTFYFEKPNIQKTLKETLKVFIMNTHIPITQIPQCRSGI